jgi:hypothetical protein
MGLKRVLRPWLFIVFNQEGLKNMPKAEEYSERKTELSGWPINIVTYRLGPTYHTTIDNTDPGAWVVKADGTTKEEAESKALKEAQGLLEKIKKSKPATGCTSVPGF